MDTSNQDKLELLFNRQDEMERFHGYVFEEMSEKQRADFVIAFTLYVENELQEMLHEIPFFKQWKRYSDNPKDNEAAWESARKEFIDVLHFSLCVALALGFTADTLFEGYMEKHRENYRRQQNRKSYKRDTE